MFKKLTIWFFFTIIAGILPLLFRFAIYNITDTAFTYQNICSEIFFFNLVLSADGLKELYDIDSSKNQKVLFYSSLIFTIIILAVLYGFLLLNNYINLNLSLYLLYTISKIFTVFCIIINFSIQLLGGAH